jgi:glycine/D-amino acid oxidase-like deaminating enzyme
MINVWAEIGRDHLAFPALSERVQLGVRAMELWDGVCAELSEFAPEKLKVIWGTYIVSNPHSSALEHSTLDYIVKSMAQLKVPHTDVRPESVSWLNPRHRSAATRVVMVPDGRIDSRKVLNAYEAAIGKKGGKLIHDRVKRVQQDNGFTLTLEAGEKITAKQILFANGSFAQELVDQLKDVKKETPRLLWGGGSAVDLTFPEWVQRDGGLDKKVFDMDFVIRTTDRGGACGLHVIPHGNGQFYLGASSGVWYEPEWAPRVHGIHVLLHSIVDEINQGFFFATMALRGPGFRPTTADGLPLIGESHIKGVWFANGTKRDGFTTSPFISRELAQAMLGNRHSLPHRFKPSRGLISYKTRALAIEDAVAAEMGGEYQHGLNLPPYAVEAYITAKRKRLNEIYDQRNIGNFGIHPEVTHLYSNDTYFAGIEHTREL